MSLVFKAVLVTSYLIVHLGLLRATGLFIPYFFVCNFVATEKLYNSQHSQPYYLLRTRLPFADLPNPP
jgi:hypothetical protein